MLSFYCPSIQGSKIGRDQNKLFPRRSILIATLFLLAIPGAVMADSPSGFSKDVASLADDFDDGIIDPGKWITGGSSVYERNGVLDIQTEVTDGGGWVESETVDFDPAYPIVLERDIFLHYSNNRFIGQLNIVLEGAPDFSFGVNYGNMDYWSEIYPARHGIFLFRNGHSGHHISYLVDNSDPIEGIWDQWFHEKLVYSPDTGELDYYIDDVLKITYFVGFVPDLSNYQLRVWTRPWGWYTGHYQHMDNFVLSAEGLVATEHASWGAVKSLYR